MQYFLKTGWMSGAPLTGNITNTLVRLYIDYKPILNKPNQTNNIITNNNKQQSYYLLHQNLRANFLTSQKINFNKIKFLESI